MNTADTMALDVTFLLLSGLRVFGGTMRRPLAEEVLRMLVHGKTVHSFGALEEVELGLFGQEVFSSGACTGGLNTIEDELVDSAGEGANLRRLRVFIGGAGGHVYHEKVWQHVRIPSGMCFRFLIKLCHGNFFVSPQIYCHNLNSDIVFTCGMVPQNKVKRSLFKADSWAPEPKFT